MAQRSSIGYARSGELGAFWIHPFFVKSLFNKVIFDLKPGFNSNGFKNYQSGISDDKFNKLVELMKQLNEDIKNDESLGEGFRIGHSYLCNIGADDVDEKLNYIVEYELIPLLKEYWFDEPDKVNNWSARLRSVLDDS